MAVSSSFSDSNNDRATTAATIKLSSQQQQQQRPSSISISSNRLSSAYDINLPPSLVGEAVRSALRSNRGVCIDFSTDRYCYNNKGSSTSASRLVSVIGMRGKGTLSFLDAKFSGSVPKEDTIKSSSNNNTGGGGGERLFGHIRTGNAFETAYLTAKGRIIDRLLVLYFPTLSSSSSSANNDEREGRVTAAEEKKIMTMEDAFVITSPGHDGTNLYDKFSPTIFPMDGVSISHCTTDTTCVITLACSTVQDVRTSFMNNIRSMLTNDDGVSFDFPEEGKCHHYRISRGGEAFADVYVVRHAFLPSEMCHGYTLLFREECGGGNSSSSSSSNRRLTFADEVWHTLTNENNDRGPVGIGALEYDTLRVESGMPGWGFEMTGDGPKNKKAKTPLADDNSREANEVVGIDDADMYHAKSNPLELHLGSLVDINKGCYQGQEGVASILKNKLGPPRQLYQIVFYDSENDFDSSGGNDDEYGGFGLLTTNNDMLTEFRKLKGEQRKDGTLKQNHTRQPRPGDEIFVLGSNDSISVGKITSVAESNGNGDAKTIALMLAKRPGTILNAIREQGLELPKWWEDVRDPDGGDDYDEKDSRGGVIANEKIDGGSSGIMRPPPLDPLHNLEVVIGGTYTVGRMVAVPGRRYGVKSKRGDDVVSSLLDYETTGEVVTAGDANVPAYFRYDFQDETTKSRDFKPVRLEPEVDNIESSEVEMDNLLAEAEKDIAKATAQAEAAAAELKRKEEKMKQREYSRAYSSSPRFMFVFSYQGHLTFSHIVFQSNQYKRERRRPWKHDERKREAAYK